MYDQVLGADGGHKIIIEVSFSGGLFISVPLTLAVSASWTLVGSQLADIRNQILQQSNELVPYRNTVMRNVRSEL